MNGIVVMDCVQTAYQGNYGIYGTRDRMIRISGRRAAAMTGTSILSNETSAVLTDSPVNRSGSETAGSKMNVSKKSGSKRFVTKKDGRIAAGCKSRDINHKEAVNTSAEANTNTAKRDIRICAVSSERREKTSSFAMRAFRVLVLTVVLTSMIAGFHMITGASGRPRQQAWKYHTTVTIPYGESFGDLIEKTFNSTYYESQDDYLKEICQINSLPYHRGEIPQLQSGTSLVIPYYSTEYK